MPETTERPTTFGAYRVTTYTEGGPSSTQMSHAELEEFIDANPEESLEAVCLSQAHVPIVSRNMADA